VPVPGPLQMDGRKFKFSHDIVHNNTDHGILIYYYTGMFPLNILLLRHIKK